jgi:phosphoglycerol transferase MdoB-like AlkP superfamily enzyme
MKYNHSPTFSAWTCFFNLQLTCATTALVAMIFMLAARAWIWVEMAPKLQGMEFWKEFFPTLWYSLRWDLKMFACIQLLVLLISLAVFFHQSLAKAIFFLLNKFILLVLFFSLLLSFINIFYWATYGNPFDIFFFSFFEDQTAEILRVVWQDYHPIRHFILFFATIFFAVFLIKKTDLKFFIAKLATRKHYIKIGFAVGLFFFLVVLARGSLTLFPLGLKTTHFSAKQFFNDLSISAPAHFYYALLKKYNNVMDAKPGIAFKSRGFSNQAAAEAKLLYRGDKTAEGIPLIKTSQSGWSGKLPNVILIMMESWSSHIFMADSPTNDLLGSFREEKYRGTLQPHFLATRHGTARFIEGILLNTSLLDLSVSSAQSTRFSYTNIDPFLQKNYGTYFVSGGARTWLNHDKFWRKQGFKDYWDMSDIMRRYSAEKHSDWGVYDEHTFNFALEKIKELQQSTQPFFMFIMTTSNHPPHSLPAGYDSGTQSLAPFESHLMERDNALKQLQTFRYSSDQLGLFLRNLAQQGLAENTIVIATGDHSMRSFYHYTEQADKLLAGAVPVYWQIPATILGEKRFDNTRVGSHRDIFPTLFELALPNVSYLKTGFNLLDITEPKAAWHERGIWLVNDKVTFAADKKLYSYDQQFRILKDDVPEGIKTENAMRAYQDHINALDALLEWQFRQEYLQKRIR